MKKTKDPLRSVRFALWVLIVVALFHAWVVASFPPIRVYQITSPAAHPSSQASPGSLLAQK